MARRASVKSLKSQTPHWFCIVRPEGTVRSLAASGKKLVYVCESKPIKTIWRYLGNPKFRSDYDYLLVGYLQDGKIGEIYGVKLPEGTTNYPGEFNAFEGDVDKILYGWTTAKQAKQLKESSEPEYEPERRRSDDL